FAGKIGVICRRTVVTRAPGTDGETQCHGLQAARIISGELETFDMHRPAGAAGSDLDCRTLRSVRQQRANLLTACNRADCGQRALTIPEPQSQRPVVGQYTPFERLHRPGDRATRADRIEPIRVAQSSRLGDELGTGDPEQRPECEDRLVLEALIPAFGFEQPLAPDGAGRAAVATAETGLRQRLAAQGIGIIERRLPEVTGRDRPHPVEYGNVGDGSEASVLVRDGTETAPPQRIGNQLELTGTGYRCLPVAADGYRFHVLRAHHRANAAAAGMAAAVADRREPDPILSPGPNRRRPQP